MSAPFALLDDGKEARLGYSWVSAAELTSMGMVGVTRGQLVRVSLFHEADVARVICPGIVEIAGADGKVLASTQKAHPGVANLEIIDKLTGRTTVALPVSLIPDL